MTAFITTGRLSGIAIIICIMCSMFQDEHMYDIKFIQDNQHGRCGEDKQKWTFIWLQLMLTLPNDLIKEHIIQAEKLGYKVLVITVDQPNVGLPRDNSHIFDMELTTFPSLKIPPNVSVVKHVSDNCFLFPITWEKIA